VKLTVIMLIVLIAGATAMDANAESLTGSTPLRLWEGDAPGALGSDEADIPTLTPFLVPNTTQSAAIIVFPGGGYHSLTPYEGDHYARWLNELGISTFVLKYRLGSRGYRHPVMLQDASRALRLVRARAAEWNVDPNRVGIIGSSAGGHLASTLMTHFDSGDAQSTDPVERKSSRPDLAILCYPAINMGDIAHEGSRKLLLGGNASEDLVTSLSTELQVTKDTPPAFLFHTADDPVVPVEHGLRFAAALADNKVPFALHIYPHGRHGLGLGTREWNPDERHPWTAQCKLWLKEQGFLAP
jgi:acetyl esterase/lipase